MNNLRVFPLAFWLASAIYAPLAAAQPRLSERDAVRIFAENNPTLELSLLSEARARYAIDAEAARYSAVFDANTGLTHTRSLSLSSNGGVSISTQDSVDLGAGLTKPFPFGTLLSFGISGQRFQRATPISVANDMEARLGPGYALTAEITVTQPLLRGAGSDLGLAALRAARLQLTSAELSSRQTASGLLRDLIRAYWELWYADRTVSINESSRDFARVQEQQARDQVASGAMSRVDALPYATRLAELDYDVVTSKTERHNRAVALAELLGRPEPGQVDVIIADEPGDRAGGNLNAEQAIEAATLTSYELKQLETQIALARDVGRTAGDPLRPRLDLDAWVSAQGLGNRQVPPAFSQVGRLEAVSAHVGLTFEVPIDDARRSAQVADALTVVRIAEKQLEATRQRLKGFVLTVAASRDAARSHLAVAEQTERISGQQVEAERERFRAGSSIAIQVQQAEDSLRRAKLRVERARIDLVAAQVELSYLSGRLLGEYKDTLATLPGAARLLTAVPPASPL